MLKPNAESDVAQTDTQEPTTLLRTASLSAAPINGELSIIGRDLKIAGDRIEISSDAALRVDGAIEGDVRAAQIAIGPHGYVQGTITGDSVDVLGRVSGTIYGRQVALRSSAEVNGDIHNQSLMIEQGAVFNGRATTADGTTTAAHSDIAQETVA